MPLHIAEVGNQWICGFTHLPRRHSLYGDNLTLFYLHINCSTSSVILAMLARFQQSLVLFSGKECQSIEYKEVSQTYFVVPNLRCLVTAYCLV